MTTVNCNFDGAVITMNDPARHELLDTIMPELPLRRRTLYGENTDSPTKSVKVDFVLLNADRKKAYFVKLKTDGYSRREVQDKYLRLCQNMCFADIIQGTITIIQTTKLRYLRKYLHLAKHLERLALVEVPIDLYDLAYPKLEKKLRVVVMQIKVMSEVKDMGIEIVYVQPNADDHPNSVSFELVNVIVSQDNDPISREFSKFLMKWSALAGKQRPS